VGDLGLDFKVMTFIVSTKTSETWGRKWRDMHMVLNVHWLLLRILVKLLSCNRSSLSYHYLSCSIVKSKFETCSSNFKAPIVIHKSILQLVLLYSPNPAASHYSHFGCLSEIHVTNKRSTLAPPIIALYTHHYINFFTCRMNYYQPALLHC